MNPYLNWLQTALSGLLARPGMAGTAAPMRMPMAQPLDQGAGPVGQAGPQTSGPPMQQQNLPGGTTPLPNTMQARPQQQNPLLSGALLSTAIQGMGGRPPEGMSASPVHVGAGMPGNMPAMPKPQPVQGPDIMALLQSPIGQRLMAMLRSQSPMQANG